MYLLTLTYINVFIYIYKRKGCFLNCLKIWKIFVITYVSIYISFFECGNTYDNNHLNLMAQLILSFVNSQLNARN